jgi:hypothetical protein
MLFQGEDYEARELAQTGAGLNLVQASAASCRRL